MELSSSISSATTEMVTNTGEDLQGYENADENFEEAMNELWQQQMYDYYYGSAGGDTENSDGAMEYYGEDKGEYGDPNEAEYGMMYYPTIEDGAYPSTEDEAYDQSSDWQMAGEGYDYYSGEYYEGSDLPSSETAVITDAKMQSEQNGPSISEESKPTPAPVDVETKPKQIKSILKNRTVSVADTKLKTDTADSIETETDSYRPYVPPLKVQTAQGDSGKVDDKPKVQVFDYQHGSQSQTVSKPPDKREVALDASDKSYSKERDYKIAENYYKHRAAHHDDYYRYYDHYYRHDDRYRASQLAYYEKYSKQYSKGKLRSKDSDESYREKAKERDDEEKEKEKVSKDKEKEAREKEREAKAMELRRKKEEHRAQVSKLFDQLKSAQKASMVASTAVETTPKVSKTEETSGEGTATDASSSSSADAAIADIPTPESTTTTTSAIVTTPIYSKKAARAALAIAAKVGIGGTSDASLPLFLRKQVTGGEVDADSAATAASTQGYPMAWPPEAMVGAHWSLYGIRLPPPGMPRPPWMARYPMHPAPGFRAAPAVEQAESAYTDAGNEDKKADEPVAPPGVENKVTAGDELPDGPPGEEMKKLEDNASAASSSSKDDAKIEETAVVKSGSLPYGMPPPRPRFGYPMMPFRPPPGYFFSPRMRPPLPKPTAAVAETDKSISIDASESPLASSEDKPTAAAVGDTAVVPVAVIPRPRMLPPPWVIPPRGMRWRPPLHAMYRSPFGAMRPGMFPSHLPPPPLSTVKPDSATGGSLADQSDATAETSSQVELGEGDMDIDDAPSETVIEVAPAVAKTTAPVVDSTSDGSLSKPSNNFVGIGGTAHYSSIDHLRYRRPPPGFPPPRMLRPMGWPPHAYFHRQPSQFAGRLPPVAGVECSDSRVLPPVSSEQLSLPPPAAGDASSSGPSLVQTPANQANSNAVPEVVVEIAAKPVRYSADRPPPPPPRAAAPSWPVLAPRPATSVPQPVAASVSAPPLTPSPSAAAVAAPPPQHRLPPPDYSRLPPPSMLGGAPPFRPGFPPPLNRPPPSVAINSPWARPPPRLPAVGGPVAAAGIANAGTYLSAGQPQDSTATGQSAAAVSSMPLAANSAALATQTHASWYEHYYKHYYQYYSNYYRSLGYPTGGPAASDPAALAAATAAATAAAQYKVTYDKWAQSVAGTGGAPAPSLAATDTTPTASVISLSLPSTDQSQLAAKKDKKTKNSKGDKRQLDESSVGGVQSDAKKSKLENVNTSVIPAPNSDPQTARATTTPAQQQTPPVLTLWVGNLPDATKAVDIKNMIGDSVKVLSCKIGMGKGAKAAGLFALISVESAAEMAVCIDKLDKKQLNGKVLETKKMKVAS